VSQNQWIREGRKAAGWSQAQLGAKVGVSQVQVSLWENGKAEPSPEQDGKLRKLLKATSALPVQSPEPRPVATREAAPRPAATLNHSEIAEFLWKIADLIKDDYDAKAYEDVILPFTLLRRLDCVLEPTRTAVREAAEKYQAVPEQTRDALLKRAAGQAFYNTSEYSLAELLKRPNDIGPNFGAYLAGFSANIKDILYNFSGGEEKGLGPIYETLLRKRLLFKVTHAFSEAPLDPATVDNHAMGTIFEYLIRKFKEASNEAAGQFYTPRDIIRLMVKLLFEPDRDRLAHEKLIGIYDPACGTGGMLTIAKEYLLAAVNPDLDIYLYGQEINEKTYAIAKADMLMKGENPDHIKRENTLSHDLLPGVQFNYMLSNPPFGKDWKNIRDEIEAEHARGSAGRYAPGLPDVGDGAMLFLLHKMSKMAPQGSKIAIIFNGSPLFNGDAGSGPSNIRRHILENDWLDAIVALPQDLFYNTGIATYIWLINNRKPSERRGRVQLINAAGEAFRTMLRRNLGKKRVEIGEDQASAILGIYEAFEESKVSKIFDTADFGYTKVTVERPLRLRYDLTPEQRAALRLDASILKLKDGRAEELSAALDALTKKAPWRDDAQFFAALEKALPFKLTQGLTKTLRALLGTRDEAAEPVRDADGNPLPDSELRDCENVPLKEEIDGYFAREVLPHVPDAWMDRSKDKVGYEISFTKYFYEYTPLRSTAEIAAELLALDEETENLLREIALG
jgi:type I restriction enzyme M protein